MPTSKPKIAAKFVLDSEGHPVVVKASAESELKHYKIELFLVDPPSSAESVTYELHSSYYDPVREVVRSSENDPFVEPITSYGDYTIRSLASGSTAPLDQTTLSGALRRGHQGQAIPGTPLWAAISDLYEK